jgi:serine/threonine protein kinase
VSEQAQRDALHNLCLADPVWSERYEGWVELGCGGSASVVRTHSKAIGEEIALKVFHRLASDDWSRFRREVGNAQRLTSPYIVKTYSPFPRGSLAWIEMELIDGPDLRQELERRAREKLPFSLAEALDIAVALASAVATAHEAGVVHRDVKPANVLLPRSRRPVAKLGDFGISRLTGAARVTKTGLLAGTPQFAAPELVAGRSATSAADVYSTSLCLYLLLSNNRFPFDLADDASAAQWMRAHAEQAPIPIRRLDPGVPPTLAVLLEKGLAKDPENRPTAEEMLDVLLAVRDSRVPGDRLPGATKPRFRPGAAAALAAGLVALAIALALRSRLESQPPAPESVASAGSEAPSARSPEATAVPAPAPSTSATSLVAASSPTPSAAPPGRQDTVRRPALFRATLTGDLLTIANLAREDVSDLRLTLLGLGGQSHVASAPGTLASGEELSVSLDSFEPSPPPGFRPRSLEITAAEPPSARRVTAIPLR